MPPVTTPTFASLQGVLLDGLAKATPAVAKLVLPELAKMLADLDGAAPFLLVAGRAYTLLKRRKKLPEPEHILDAFVYAGREVAQRKLFEGWARLKPIWSDPPEIV